MGHVVFFTEATGEPAFRRVGELDEAVSLVERLRNERGVTDAAVHALTPVPLSFRTYYRVEVGPTAEPRVSSDPAAQQQPVDGWGPIEEETPVDPEVPADTEGPTTLSPLLLLAPPPVVPPVPVGLLRPLELAPADDPAKGSGDGFDTPVDQPVDAEASADAAPGADEDAAAFVSSYEALVPQVRSDAESEHSLGYFAH